MNKKVIFVTFFALLIDQISKILISNFVVNKIVIINNFFQINYVQNTGAAWSIFQGKQILLIIISILFLIMIYKYSNNFKNNKKNIIAFGLLYGGILGNLIDRIIHGYVIDFLDFKIFNYDYPVFNMADTFIVIGIILMIIAIFKGEDNENISRRK